MTRRDLLGIRPDVPFAPKPNVVVLLAAPAAAPAAAVPVTSACAVVRDSLGRLLLTHEPGRGYDLPGGHVERGETPGRACRREIAEETGLTLAFDVGLRLAAAIQVEIAAPRPACYRYPWPRSQMWVFDVRLAEPGGEPRPGTECTHARTHARWVRGSDLARLCPDRIWLPVICHQE
jgi:8-oxo-dGTP pyrophosphatase MutT (NUDIX family)